MDNKNENEQLRELNLIITETRLAAGARSGEALLDAVCRLGNERDAANGYVAAMRDMLEAAWGLIANVHRGNWMEESEEWQIAAKKWRDRYSHSLNPRHCSQIEEINK